MGSIVGNDLGNWLAAREFLTRLRDAQDNQVPADFPKTHPIQPILGQWPNPRQQRSPILAKILAFFNSDLGQRVVDLEIEARRAFLDTEAEEAARVAADDRFAARDPKVELVKRFIEAGDLVEMNVAGALSGNLAFLTGMSETVLYGEAMPTDQLMSDVWAQEEQIRDDSTAWLYAYLGLAYAPLTEAELQSYVDFMESPEGKRLNGALFIAFNDVFRQVSYDLGRAAGLAIQGTDI